MSTIDILPRHFGAADLKASYNRNLGAAFFIAILVHGLIVLLYILLNGSAPAPRVVSLGGDPYGPIPFGPSTTCPAGGEGAKGTGGAPKGNSGHGSAPKAMGALPMPGISQNDTLPFGLPFGGDFPQEGAMGGLVDDPMLPPGENPDPPARERSAPPREIEEPIVDIFAVEKEPVYDEGELLRKLRYPELAARNGVEGVVVVHVLISCTGKAVQAVAEPGSNKLLAAAAEDAVRSIPYAPAIQNHTPVAVWMVVPITFSLH